MFKPHSLGTQMICVLVCCVLLVGFLDLPVHAAKAKPVSTSQAAKVYYASDEDAQVIGVLEDGTTLTVLVELGEYFRIDCYGQAGYIAVEQVAWDPSTGEYYVSCVADSDETVSLQIRPAQALKQVREDLLELALAQEGDPYVFGGETPGGFDCSGFINYLYRSQGYEVSRTAEPQLAESLIIDPEKMEPGDLVFFWGTDDSDDFITHVGLYLGDGMFIHAGSPGICVRALDDGYFAEHFQCARRLLLAGTVQADFPGSLELN